MNDSVSAHYRGGGSLVHKIASDLREAGVEPNELSASDFESIDEFHFRGREATLQLLEQLQLAPASKFLYSIKSKTDNERESERRGGG